MLVLSTELTLNISVLLKLAVLFLLNPPNKYGKIDPMKVSYEVV